MTTDVKQQRPDYLAQCKTEETNRAVILGERMVKAGGTAYLPPLASMMYETHCNSDDGSVSYTPTANLTPEGLPKYNKYKSLAFFYGATGYTLEGLKGLVFAKPAQYELTPNTEYLETNVDGKGTSLREFARGVFSYTSYSPLTCYLADFPATEGRVNKATSERMGLRPRILAYRCSDIINRYYETINNQSKLSLLVLREKASIRDGFKVEEKERYRVYEVIDSVCHTSLYDENSDLIEEARPIMFNGKSTDKIPAVLIENEDKTPFDDLVDMNLLHYKISADYGGKLHYSSFVIYTETGAESGANAIIGNGVKWNNSSSDAKFDVLQPDGNADSHRLALKDTEARLAALGAEQLRERTGSAESGEAKAIDKVAQNSITADTAITASEAITKLLNLCDEWQGGSGGIEYKLNTDYNRSH